MTVIMTVFGLIVFLITFFRKGFGSAIKRLILMILVGLGIDALLALLVIGGILATTR